MPFPLSRATAALAIIALCSASPVHAQQPPSAEAFYANALERMRQIAEPQFATYHTRIRIQGANLQLTRSPRGRVVFGVNIGTPGLKPYGDFRAAYRASDHLVAIDTPQGWGTAHGTVLDPTWSGVDDLIRYGFNDPPAPAASATPSPAPAGANSTTPVIAVIHAIGIAYYSVYDGGEQPCANGDAGHRVHLVARENPHSHPLSDAVIDLRTGKLCSMSFAIRQGGIFSASGDITLDLAEQGLYTIVDHERFEFTAHAFAIAVKHVVGNVAFSDLRFPASVSPQFFAPPTPTPNPSPAHAR